MTGSPERQREARAAARAFTPGADLSVDTHDLPDGRLPAAMARSRRSWKRLARSEQPDIVLAPSVTDATRTTGTVAELVPTAFRDQLYLAYEIPKWDGDLGRPNAYLPLTDEVARRKVELLDKCYPSQGRP